MHKTLSVKKMPQTSGEAAALDHDPADVTRLVDYVLANQLIGGNPEDVPLDRSLVEEGILDSYDIIELVDFIERTWNIRIADEEIKKENMGSIYRMAAFISRKNGTWSPGPA